MGGKSNKMKGNSMNYVTMKEFEETYAKNSPLAIEVQEHIKKKVKFFFGSAEIAYRYCDDENLIQLLGVIPVQRLKQEELVNNIITSARFNNSIDIEVLIKNAFSGLRFDAPKDLC